MPTHPFTISVRDIVRKPGQMREVVEDAPVEGAVEDAALHERHALRHEVRVPAGEVVDDDGVEPGILQGAHDVRPDVSRASGDQPAHVAPHVEGSAYPADPRVFTITWRAWAGTRSRSVSTTSFWTASRTG